MHYKSEVEGVVRIPPQLFGEELLTAIEKQLKTDYEGRTFADLGKVMAILEMGDIGEGVLIPGDGAAYYRLKFTILNYTPEINELVNGEIKDIAKFGALTGKQTKHALKIGDKVRARIVAISMKDPRTPKIGLTMRQPYLGKLEWIEAETKKEAKVATKKASKEKEKE